MNSIISLEEFKVYLKFIGVDISKYSDKELELILNLLNKFLDTRLGGLVFGYNVTDIFNHKCQDTFYQCGETIRLKQFPVQYLINTTLPVDSYFLHGGSGVIEFTKDYTNKGLLKVTYKVGFSKEQITNLIVPLFFLLIKAYFNPTGEATSLTEGEVSISYGQSSLMDKALTRLDDLFNKYNKRVEMLE